MNFSEVFKKSHNLCSFSPNGAYLLTCWSYKVTIRTSDTLQIVRLYTCMDAVQEISWSSDSNFIMCCMYKRNCVQVWSMEQPDWTCKIDEGSAGLVHARWSPDGRHVLTSASFNLRLTVWSLINKSISYIRYLKNAVDCVDFSKDGKYLAVGECRKCKDYISVYNVASWDLLKLFEIDTDELAGIKWSPDSRVIVAWENCLWYKLFIYTVDGRCLTTYKPYEFGLGIKSVAWSPTSQFLAVGSYDQKLRILNHITWKCICEFDHKPSVKEESVVVYDETTIKTPNQNSSSLSSSLKSLQLFTSHTKYDVVATPTILPHIMPDPEKPNPKVGVSWSQFSPDNKYLATVEDSMKNVVHIWSVQKLSLFVVLKQSQPIKFAVWSPSESKLAICTNTDKLYLWSPGGAVSTQLPVNTSSKFFVNSIKWHPSGGSLALLTKDDMIMCYLTTS